ncbi:MAG: prepilin-type N-terminal cleavage/methylation domain-containing protein [Clostridium celatum]|nr:prepilin-type N-terminal cleavage/methylation domain-containing protein [Clostridium celatum]
MLKNLRNKKKKGFTLIELIIVIAIIAILAAIAVPQFGKIREKANVSADISNAKNIYSAVAAQVADEKIAANVAHTNGTVTTPANIAGDTNVVEYLGSNNLPKPKAYQHTQFAYSVIDGNITIYIVQEGSTVDSEFTDDKIGDFIIVYPSATPGSKYTKVTK